MAPPEAYNPAEADFVYWSTDQKISRTPVSDHTHPFYGLNWYRPSNLLPQSSSVKLFVVGVLSLDDVTTKILTLLKDPSLQKPSDESKRFIDINEGDG